MKELKIEYCCGELEEFKGLKITDRGCLELNGTKLEYCPFCGDRLDSLIDDDTDIFWRWKVKTATGWLKTDYYFNEDGLTSAGDTFDDLYDADDGWDDLEKEKIEDDYIEIDIDDE